MHTPKSPWLEPPCVCPSLLTAGRTLLETKVLRGLKSLACSPSKPALTPHPHAPTAPGYGVEAVLKNMEYSAMDEKKKGEAPAAAQGAAEDAPIDDAPLGEVKGFRWVDLDPRGTHLLPCAAWTSNPTT